MKIWFTSDTHYNHKNICRGTSQWDLKEGGNHQRTRDFNTLDEMNDAIVKGINDNVAENDILYHLGDWSFGGIDSIYAFRRRINCKNIHLILGNHDHHIENNRRVSLQEDANEHYDNTTARSLFSSVSHVLNKEIGGQKMVLCHYAMRTWDKAHHGTWMLYGHSHGTLDDYWHPNGYQRFRTIDVGIDSIFRYTGEYRPISLDELKEAFKDRPALLVDHHNENTN